LWLHIDVLIMFLKSYSSHNVAFGGHKLIGDELINSSTMFTDALTSLTW
jgi:hypothetical protein